MAIVSMDMYYTYSMNQFLKNNKDEPDVNSVNDVVRATFTIPKNEIDLIDEIQRQLGLAGEIFNKSEVIRAAVLALRVVSQEELLSAAKKVRRLKPGRQKHSEWISQS